MTSAAPATIRPATLDDVDELVRLRSLMFEHMDLDPRPEVWAKTCGAFLEETLADGTTGAFVADVGRPRLVASGIGTTCRRLTGPNNPSGRYGYIASMVTEVGWRGRGLARGIVVALLDWFGAQGIDRVDLHASTAGDPIYRALGFTTSTYPELRWSRPLP